MNKVTIRKLDDLDFQSNEAYKTLRTNLEFCGNDVKIIAITSCTPNEGKTSVSLNLCRSLAELGKKVLFLDTDLRKSVVVGRYKVDGEILGLTHFLTGKMKFHDVVYETNVPKLHMVFAGPVPPNPAELLSNRYFKSLIPTLREVYDYVIIDTPPLGSVIDSAIIASECDGVALLVSANHISYKFAQKVVEQLKVTECRILGVILNKVDHRERGYYGRYYGKYYGKYYGRYYGSYGYGEENIPTKKK